MQSAKGSATFSPSGYFVRFTLMASRPLSTTRSDSHETDKFLDFFEFSRAEMKVSGPDYAPRLAGPARADDGAGYGFMVQHPGYRHFTWRAPMTIADGPQQSYQLEVAR